MKITIWGSRGSITTPGAGTIRYGGNSTCLELRPREGGVIIIDAGSGARLLGKKLLAEQSLNELYFILTHAHWDHLSGFPFFIPAYMPRFTINVYGGPNAQKSLKNYLSHQMNPPFFPVDFSLMKAKFTFDHECPDMGRIGLVDFMPVPLSHPNGGYGYKFTKIEKTFVFLTDNELSYTHPGGLSRKEYSDICRGTDLLIHDAQYTDDDYTRTRGWGHSTYREVTELAMEAGVKRLILFHHDPDRTDDDLDRQTDICRDIIMKAGVNIACHAAAEGMEIEI